MYDDTCAPLASVPCSSADGDNYWTCCLQKGVDGLADCSCPPPCGKLQGESTVFHLEGLLALVTQETVVQLLGRTSPLQSPLAPLQASVPYAAPPTSTTPSATAARASPMRLSQRNHRGPALPPRLRRPPSRSRPHHLCLSQRRPLQSRPPAPPTLSSRPRRAWPAMTWLPHYKPCRALSSTPPKPLPPPTTVPW